MLVQAKKENVIDVEPVADCAEPAKPSRFHKPPKPQPTDRKHHYGEAEDGEKAKPHRCHPGKPPHERAIKHSDTDQTECRDDRAGGSQPNHLFPFDPRSANCEREPGSGCKFPERESVSPPTSTKP